MKTTTQTKHTKRRPYGIFVVLGLLAPAAGCQLTTHDNLTTTPGASDTSLVAPGKNDLSPAATAKVCLATAEALDKEGKAGEAIVLYEKARHNGAQNPQVSRRLALLYDQQGDSKRALEEYKQLLKHNAKDADLLNDAGYCYYNLGKWDEAEKCLRQAVAINPGHARAWINLGMTLAQEKRTDESLAAFQKVVSPAQAQCNLAFILQTQKKYAEAKAAYRQALTLEPELALARLALAKLEKASVSPTPPAFPEVSRREREVARERVDDQAPVEVPLPQDAHPSH
jgi:tetratricopeptide (TPR) repeat protein